MSEDKNLKDTNTEISQEENNTLDEVIEVIKEEKKSSVNAKSIMGIMSLGLAKGDELTISAKGEDEETAVNTLVELIESGFGE